MDVLKEIFKSPVQRELDRAIQLEERGEKNEALNLMMDLVMNHPSCKVCRYEMGRLATEMEKDNIKNSSIKAVN